MNDSVKAVKAVRECDYTLMSSGPEISLASHLMTFAAERARKNVTIEAVK